MQQVIVNIDAEGNVKVEAQGVVGQGCEALTRSIEQSLGRTVADKKKAEYFQPAQESNRARNVADNQR